ncbi:MAG: hypothetical protein R3C16_04610 [Hyphomonadaceae bacterium]
MSVRIVLAALAFMLALPVSAVRAEPPPIVVRDPAVFARVEMDAITLSGARAFRELFVELLGRDASLPADVEAGLLVYERANLHLPAAYARVVDDVAEGDALRVIYLYHYFGDTSWVFTRLEFVAIGSGEWALARFAFSDRWSGVALTMSPGARSVTPTR